MLMHLDGADGPRLVFDRSHTLQGYVELTADLVSVPYLRWQYEHFVYRTKRLIVLLARLAGLGCFGTADKLGVA